MKRTFIIAEAGVNHNGNLELAKQLIDVAAEAGADAVKFQTFRAETLACKNAQKANYQMETTEQGESQFEMLKKLELSYDMHIVLIDYCKKKGIQFMSTPFDVDSIFLLSKLNVSIFKIPSGEITNLPYLETIGKLGKPIILSTGMSNIEEIKAALAILQNEGATEISLLHCNTQYPTPMEDVNLQVIPELKKKLNVSVGYSDHTQGIEVSIAAVALGADIIEKHFTLDHNMSGPDHKASLEPIELKCMIKAIRNIETALGTNQKLVTNSEKGNVEVVRKSIVAKCDIKQGELFTTKNLTTKRPGNGISPMKWNEVIGLRATRNYREDEMIQI